MKLALVIAIEHLIWISGPRQSLCNWPFPSSLVPLFQSKSKCETIVMKITSNCMKMKLYAELIFIWKVSHLDSFWNGLLFMSWTACTHTRFSYPFNYCELSVYCPYGSCIWAFILIFFFCSFLELLRDHPTNAWTNANLSSSRTT